MMALSYKIPRRCILLFVVCIAVGWWLTSSFPRAIERRLGASESRPVADVPGKLLWDPDYHLYTINGKPVIWVFWNSNEIPPIMRLSMASLICHNPELHFQVVRLRDIEKWLNYVHPSFYFLIPAHQADYFRARVLDEYGGVYVDIDSIGFGSFWDLVQKLRWYEMVGVTWTPDGDNIAVGHLGPLRAHIRFTAIWVSKLHLKLDADYEKLMAYHRDGAKNAYPLHWGDILRGLVLPTLNHLMDTNAVAYFSLTGHLNMGQFVRSGYEPQSNVSAMTRPFSFRETQLMYYHNSAMPHYLRQLNASALLSSDYLIGRLLGLSLEHCFNISKGSAVALRGALHTVNSQTVLHTPTDALLKLVEIHLQNISTRQT